MIQIPPGTRRVAVATDIWERLRETPSPAMAHDAAFPAMFWRSHGVEIIHWPMLAPGEVAFGALVETVHRERSLHEDYIARIIAANRPETDG